MVIDFFERMKAVCTLCIHADELTHAEEALLQFLLLL